MLRTLHKRMILRSYKYWRRNLSVYESIHFRESSFHFRGNSTIHFNHKKNEQRNEDRYFDETNEKSVNYCKQPTDQVQNFKKLCVHACTDSTSPSLFAYVPILMELKRIIEIRHQTGRVCTTVTATTFRIQGGLVNL